MAPPASGSFFASRCPLVVFVAVQRDVGSSGTASAWPERLDARDWLCLQVLFCNKLQPPSLLGASFCLGRRGQLPKEGSGAHCRAGATPLSPPKARILGMGPAVSTAPLRCLQFRSKSPVHPDFTQASSHAFLRRMHHPSSLRTRSVRSSQFPRATDALIRPFRPGSARGLFGKVFTP